MALNTAFAILPGFGIDDLPEDILDVTGDVVLGEEAASNALPAGYLGVFETTGQDGEPACVIVGYELMVEPDLIPELADEAITAVFAGNSSTWLLIIDSPDSSRMLSLAPSGITAQDGEPVEGEPTDIDDDGVEATLKRAVFTLSGVDLDAIMAAKGVLAVVED